MKKIQLVFWNICLFLFIGINCIRPITINVVREAFIGSAFSFRINDVIHEAYPAMDTQERIELQQFMEKHPQLGNIIHRYLYAYADYLAGDAEALEMMDNGQAFRKMNQEILKEAQKRGASHTMEISEEEFWKKAGEAEANMEAILRETIPQYLSNYGELADLAMRIYPILTSLWLQAALLAALLVSAIVIYRKAEGNKALLWRLFGKMVFLQGCFWGLLVPLLMKIFQQGIFSLTNRMLGRTMFIEAEPFLLRGGVLAGLGLFLLLFGLKISELRLAFWKKTDIM